MTSKQEKKKDLVLARESSVGSEAQVLLGHLFQNIVRGLKDKVVSVPDFDDVVERFRHPHRHGATEYRKRGMKAVLVQHEDHDVLLSLGSARKLDEAGDNAFVDVLVSLLETGDYDRVISTSISRLCRNTMLAGKLELALKRNRVSLLLGDTELEVWDLTGQLMWVLLVWFANFEAQQIEARLTAGKVARAHNGQWSFGYHPPPGWKLTQNKEVEVDPESAEAIRWLISGVAQGETNFSHLAREVIDRWPNLESRRGSGRLADQRHPATQLRRSWLSSRWFPVYVGEPYRAKFIPDEEKRTAQGRGEGDSSVEVVFHLPPQPEPIATQAQIDRVIAVLDAATSSREATGRGTTLGSGISADADDVKIDPALLDSEERWAS